MPTPSIFDQLVTQGNLDIAQEKEEKENNFAKKLGALLANVRNGDLSYDILDRLGEFFEDPSKSINSGTMPLAIGSGNGTIDELAAVQILVDSDNLPDGVKRAIQRVIAQPADPMRIAVESDGTPTEFIRMQRAITDLTAETLSLKKDIQDSEDELAAAKQNPAGTMVTATINASAEAIHTILEKGKARQAGLLVNPTYTLPEADYKELVEKVNQLRDASKVAAPKPAPPKRKP